MDHPDTSAVGGWWWRFTDYQIVDSIIGGTTGPRVGRCIMPTPTAQLEPYKLGLNPGDRLGGSRGRQEKKDGHYIDFLHLELEDEDAIINWCRRYGLLGILCQENVRLQMAPRWRRVRQTDSSGSRYIFTPYETIYVRSPEGWYNTYESTPWSRELAYEGNGDQWGCLAEPREGGLPNPPLATTMRIFSSGYEGKPLGETIGNFFPMVPLEEKDSFLYPQPLSDEFWYQYSEPIENFQGVARDFRDMLDNLSYAGLRNDQVLRATGRALHGQHQINSVLSVNPSLRIEEDGSTSPRWDFPSLIAALAFEVWQDLIGGQTILHCQRANCSRLFLSAQYNRGYCSDKCRWAAEKARQRRRNQEK